MKAIGIILVTFFLTLTIIINGCSKDEDKKSSGPKVVGCNKVEYKGHTWIVNGCGVGGASAFDIELGERDANGNWITASFTITCSGSCIETAKVKTGGLQKTIVGPN